MESTQETIGTSMDPNPEALVKPFRVILKLGKFQVVERGDAMMKIFLGGSTTMTVHDPILRRTDVKVGDILTFYSEVPLHANLGSPPQQ